MKTLSSGTISRRTLGRFNYNAWPSVAKLNDGTLLAVWSGYRYEHVCPFGKVLASRSNDGGKTWSEPYKVLDTPLDDRDAGLCVSGDRIYLTSFNNSRKQQRKYMEWYDDEKRNAFYEGYLNLLTDEDERRFLGSVIAVSKDNGYTFSEPKVLPITSPHGPLALPNGKLLFVGRAFGDAAKASFDYLPEGIYSVEIDEKLNYSKPKLVASPPETEGLLYCEPHACLLNSGRILVAIRVQGKDIFDVHTCYSDDGGKTYSKPAPTGADGSPPHLLLHSSGALEMVYARRKPAFGEYAKVSYDEGETWSDEMLIASAPDGDIGYPCTAETKDGKLVTVYYQCEGKHTPRENDIRFTVWEL